jgi:Zn-dependent peptidase ImmA (M78 family)
MLALVESKGLRVFALPEEDREVDALSFWHGNRPFIFLNTSKSAERLRFDLAHELGHLCMHRDIQTNRNRRYELDANTFASSFLIPKYGLLRQLVGRLTLADVMRLKRSWKVSAVAMVRRLHQLGRITDWQYRSWMIELSQRGFRREEPGGIAHEQSALLRQVLAYAREDGWTINRISTEMGISRSDLTEGLSGLTIIPVGGGLGDSHGNRDKPPESAPILRIVR